MNNHSNCDKCGVGFKKKDHHLRQYCSACVYISKYGLSQIMYNTLDYLYELQPNENGLLKSNYRVQQLLGWKLVDDIGNYTVHLNDKGVKFWEVWKDA